METLLTCIVLACLGAVVYSYLLYPLLLAGLAARSRHDDARPSPTCDATADCALPQVTMVIAAYNEERHLRARLENLLALDYPPQRLRIRVGSDGSTDATAAILAACRDPRLQGVAFECNRGKASVLNELVAQVPDGIVAFSDANTFFARDALRRLVAPFADPRVGGASGELHLKVSHGDNQDGLYWRIEQRLKRLESRIGALLGANGAIYAIRRELWQPLPADTICDDFCVAMNVAAAGYRLVYVADARAEEEAPPAISDEYQRRVRIGIGNLQALLRHPEYLWRTSPATAFAYVSHKVLRWIAPHLLLLALVASLLLGRESPAWLAFGVLQLAGYLASALLYVLSKQGVRLPGPLRIPAFLFALHWAFLIASLHYAGGRYGGSWHRSRR